MKRLVLAVAACALVTGLSVPAGPLRGYPETGFGVPVAFAAGKEPEAIVREIYGQWNPCCTTFNVIDTHFSPGLMKLYREVEDGAGDDIEYAIDFDIFLDAQDEDTVTGVKTTLKPEGDGKAVVKVSYTAFGETRRGTYTFLRTRQGWKIDNMGWGPDRPDLRAMLDDLRAQQKKR